MSEQNGVTYLQAARLIRQLTQGGRVTLARLDATVVDLKLSAPKVSILQQLAVTGEAMPLPQLTAQLRYPQPVLTSLVGQLAGDGMVEQATDHGDQPTVRITELGTERCATAVEAMRQSEREIMEMYSAVEIDQLSSLLQRVLDRWG